MPISLTTFNVHTRGQFSKLLLCPFGPSYVTPVLALADAMSARSEMGDIKADAYESYVAAHFLELEGPNSAQAEAGAITATAKDKLSASFATVATPSTGAFGSTKWGRMAEAIWATAPVFAVVGTDLS